MINYMKFEEEQAIINITKDNSSIKQEEITKKFVKSLRTVKTRITELQEKDLIARKNSERKWRMNTIAIS